MAGKDRPTGPPPTRNLVQQPQNARRLSPFSAARFLGDKDALIARIEKITADQPLSANRIRDEKGLGFKSSAVLFPLCACPVSPKGPAEICLMLTKRSPYVRQPGDLCCPGGGYSLPLDRLLGALLNLPYSPLQRWSGWRQWKGAYGGQERKLRLLLAAALREGWEEVRLNPFGMHFLGPLPEQRLVVFNRVICPLAVWVDGCRPIRPNNEVQRVVCIPLRSLLDPARYGRFQPWLPASEFGRSRPLHNGFFPCYIHQDSEGRELVWGVTFRVVEAFLASVLGFKPPAERSLPIVRGLLDAAYPYGRSRSGRQLIIRDD